MLSLEVVLQPQLKAFAFKLMSLFTSTMHPTTFKSLVVTLVAFGSFMAVESHITAKVKTTCNSSINSVVYSPGSMGKMGHCVSRAAFYGPSTPFKD